MSPEPMPSETRDPEPWRRRAGVALVHTAVLAGLFLLFRFEKALFVGLAPGVMDALALFLPELGMVLVLASVWLVAAKVSFRGGGASWWVFFLATLALFHALALVEHSFFQHTAIRVHLKLLAYAIQNFGMIAGIAAFGIDSDFLRRLLAILLLLPLATYLGWRIRTIGRWITPRLWGLLLAIGLVMLVWRPTAQVRNADLSGSTLVKLLRPLPSAEELAATVPEEMRPSEPVYETPRLVGGASRRPNVVLVILESTRADMVPPLARPALEPMVPHAAALVQESLAFESVYATVTHTSKALVGILCGMFPRLEMAIYESYKGNLPLACLPHLLGELGYRTTFLQSAVGTFENRAGLVRNMGYQQAAFQETVEREGFQKLGYFGMEDRVMVEPALEAAREEPFFLTLLTVATHHPYHVPGGPRRLHGLEQQAAGYLLAIQHQDAFLGELIAGLRQAGKMEETLFFVVGDHGEAFGEHLRMQHDIVPYEEVVRVPLLIRGPADLVGPARRVGGLRSQLDLLPTLLEVLEVPWEGRLPGKSLLSSEGHERVLASCWFTSTCLALREGDRKWVYHFGQRHTEVFDLAGDPLEREDLAPGMSAAELGAGEHRILAEKIGIDSFWAEHPPRLRSKE